MEKDNKTDPIRLILLTLALGLGTFIQILDTSIANVSIPFIAGDLGVSPTEGTWVITSFAISNAIVLPLTGFLAIRFPATKVFIWSTFLFSISSLLCGLAWSLPSLIFFRVIQGASGGVLIPLSQSLLIVNYPKEKKNMAIGIWSTIIIVAPMLGPIIGGWITDNYGWRWIFYINIPIGFFSGFLTYTLFKNEKEKTHKMPLDVVGLGLMILAIGCMQIVLDKGDQLDWFSSPFIVTLSLISLASFYFFIPWNYLSPNPVVDFSCFKYRNFTVGTILAAFGFMLFFGGSVVLLPLWLQTQMDYTAFLAGLAIAPIGLIPLFFSVTVGKYLHRMDVRWVITVSFLIFAYTFFWFSGFTTSISLEQIMLPRFLQGIGVVFYFVPLVVFSLAPIPHDKIASASGIYSFVRLVAGGGIGTSVFVSLWSRWSAYYQARIMEALNFDVVTNYFKDLGLLGSDKDATFLMLNQIVNRQASMLSLNDLFYISGWMFLILIIPLWFCNKSTPPESMQDEPLLLE